LSGRARNTPMGCEGRTDAPKRALARVVKAVLPDSDKGVVRHTFCHPAATWHVQRSPFPRAGFFFV
jgi:hypothetical protein